MCWYIFVFIVFMKLVYYLVVLQSNIGKVPIVPLEKSVFLVASSTYPEPWEAVKWPHPPSWGLREQLYSRLGVSGSRSHGLRRHWGMALRNWQILFIPHHWVCCAGLIWSSRDSLIPHSFEKLRGNLTFADRLACSYLPKLARVFPSLHKTWKFTIAGHPQP